MEPACVALVCILFPKIFTIKKYISRVDQMVLVISVHPLKASIKDLYWLFTVLANIINRYHRIDSEGCLSYFDFFCDYEIQTKSDLGKERVCLTARLQLIIKGSQGRISDSLLATDIKQNPCMNTAHCLRNHGFLSLLLYNPRTVCPEVEVGS